MKTTQKTPVIIFDFGGVLIDWSPYYLYRKVMKDDQEIKAFLEEIDFKNWNPKFDRGYPFEKGVQEKCAEFPQHAELIRRFNSHWMDAMGDVVAETSEVARRLKEAGYPLYGLSNWADTTFNRVKDRFYFLDYLEDYILSGRVKQVKPEPEIYHTLLNLIGRPAGECLFIDDSLENIKTAQALGFQTIHYQSAAKLERDLKEMGLRF